MRTGEGERSVGQIPDVTAGEALAFYVRRFEALDLEVSCWSSGSGRARCPPTRRAHSISTAQRTWPSANAVGDLDGAGRPAGGARPRARRGQSEARKAERAKQHEATTAAKEGMVAEAETLAAGQ